MSSPLQDISLLEVDAAVREKAMTMQEKTEYVKDSFPDLPKSETVIQNYRGSYHRSLEAPGVSGKVWVTQNFLLFCTKELHERALIAIGHIKEVVPRKSFFVFNTVLELSLEDGSHRVLTGLYHRDELYYLLQYLHSFPPVYFAVKKEPKKQGPMGGMDTKKEEREEVSGRWSVMQSSLEGQAGQYEAVDVAISDKCLAIADEVAFMGLEVRGRLEDQATTLDRVDRSMDEINESMQQSHKKLRAVEGVSGVVINLVEKPFEKKLGAYEAPDRMAGSQDSEHYYDVPILAKHPNDSFQPGILRFGDSHFVVVDSLLPSHPQMREYRFQYSQVAAVVLRARPFHVDVRFSNEEPQRFRCMSSFVQMIANELFLRTQARGMPCVVSFEPGVREFAFGEDVMRNYALDSSSAAAAAEAVTAEALFQSRRFAKTTQDIVTKADVKTKADLDHVDENLVRLQARMSQIHVTADDIGDEGQRQVEQLRKIHHHADANLNSAHQGNHRVRQLL